MNKNDCLIIKIVLRIKRKQRKTYINNTQGMSRGRLSQSWDVIKGIPAETQFPIGLKLVSFG